MKNFLDFFMQKKMVFSYLLPPDTVSAYTIIFFESGGENYSTVNRFCTNSLIAAFTFSRLAGAEELP